MGEGEGKEGGRGGEEREREGEGERKRGGRGGREGGRGGPERGRERGRAGGRVSGSNWDKGEGEYGLEGERGDILSRASHSLFRL